MSERKSEILAVARDLLLEHGLAGVSMRKVAGKVGVSATAIYRHYGDKDELIADVVEEGHRIFSTYLLRSLSEPSPRERLLAAGANYLRFALEHETYYRLIFMSRDVLGAQKELKKRYPGHSPTFQFLLDRVAECQRAGLGGARRDPLQVAIFLWAVCHGLAALCLTGGLAAFDRKDFWKYAEGSVAQAVDGLLSRKARSPSRKPRKRPRSR